MADSREQPPAPMTDAKYLFHGLAWPAVAGNVAWSFFSLVIAPPMQVPLMEWRARVAVLLLMALYLGGDWVRTRDKHGSFPYWAFDALHLICITMFVIATATAESQVSLNVWLLALYLVTALGHYCGAFQDEPVVSQNYYAGANFLGVPIVLACIYWDLDVGAWHLLGSVASVLAVWLFCRLAQPWEAIESYRKRRAKAKEEAAQRAAAALAAKSTPPIPPDTSPSQTTEHELPKPGPHAQ